LCFYGPPGTGKTWVAERLALHLVNGQRSRIALVQFHPAYSYEHFVEGYQPEIAPDGRSLLFRRVDGVLLDLVSRIARSGQRHVLLIDEINRGDLSHIFGELTYLLSRRREQTPVHLARSRRPVTLPAELSILGTMNTSDRSIAPMDLALRRRFRFFSLGPQVDLLTERLLATGVDEAFAGAVGDLLGELNRSLAQEGSGALQLGHGYFFGLHTLTDLQELWEQELFPLLEDALDRDPERLEAYQWPRMEVLFQGFLRERKGELAAANES
jgi:5-methylcytosine-specific restriction enzyme B